MNDFMGRDSMVAEMFSNLNTTAALVTYRGKPDGPNAGQSVSWAATVDKTEYPDADNSGIVDTSLETRDFVGLASALILNGSVVEPQRGDLIDEVIGGVTYTREVMAPPGEKHYDYDASYLLIRVRTWQRTAEA